MKMIVLALVSLAVAQTTSQGFLTDNKQIVLQVLQGVVEGLSAEAHIDLDTIQACILNSETVVNDLKGAIDLLKTNDLRKVEEGIKKIGEAIQVLPDAINHCRASEQELVEVAKEITKLLAQMRHPITFAFEVGKNLLLNGVQIFHETETAVHDWTDKNYEDFGVQVGKILYQLLVKKLQNMGAVDSSMKVTMTVFQGVYKGFYEQGGFRIEDVQSCISKSEGAVVDFIGGVQLIATKDPKQVQEGLRLLGMALQILPDAMNKCEGTIAEITVLTDKLTLVISQLEQPQTFAFHVGKDLLINGRDIYAEINKAVVDWNKQDYADFGYQLGKALYQLFVGSSFVAIE